MTIIWSSVSNYSVKCSELHVLNWTPKFDLEWANAKDAIIIAEVLLKRPKSASSNPCRVLPVTSLQGSLTMLPTLTTEQVMCVSHTVFTSYLYMMYDNRTLWGSSSEEIKVPPRPASGDRPHRRATSATWRASVSARSTSAAAAADRGPPSAVRQTGPRAGGLRETGRGRRDDAASQQGHLDGLHEPRRDETIFRRQNRLLAGDGRGPGEELRPRVPIACLRQHAQWVSGFLLESMI